LPCFNESPLQSPGGSDRETESRRSAVHQSATSRLKLPGSWISRQTPGFCPSLAGHNPPKQACMQVSSQSLGRMRLRREHLLPAIAHRVDGLGQDRQVAPQIEWLLAWHFEIVDQGGSRTISYIVSRGNTGILAWNRSACPAGVVAADLLLVDRRSDSGPRLTNHLDAFDHD